MGALTKVNVFNVATQLDDPFSMLNLAYVGDIIVSIYLCHGELGWHRHVDIDELFWVCEGSMHLDSEWGDVRLYPDELTVVPKGVQHRSRSEEPARVLLLRCGFLTQRKNGRRHLYTVEQSQRLGRANLYDVVDAIEHPFRFHPVARVDGSILHAGRGEGSWPIDFPLAHDKLFYVLEGAATIRTPHNLLHLHPGDLTVIPKETIYRLFSPQETALIQVTREDRR